MFKENQNLERLKKVSSLYMENLQCVVCYDNPKNVIFKECHHMVVCKQCYEKLRKKTCPICKQRIESIITIYVG